MKDFFLHIGKYMYLCKHINKQHNKINKIF